MDKNIRSGPSFVPTHPYDSAQARTCGWGLWPSRVAFHPKSTRRNKSFNTGGRRMTKGLRRNWFVLVYIATIVTIILVLLLGGM